MLQSVDVAVQPRLRGQLPVAALLYDAPCVQDDDVVGVLQGGDAVRHQDVGAAAAGLEEGVQYFFFGLGVDRGQGVVEDQQLRVDQHGAADGDALFLAAGEG